MRILHLAPLLRLMQDLQIGRLKRPLDIEPLLLDHNAPVIRPRALRLPQVRVLGAPLHHQPRGDEEGFGGQDSSLEGREFEGGKAGDPAADHGGRRFGLRRGYNAALVQDGMDFYPWEHVRG